MARSFLFVIFCISTLSGCGSDLPPLGTVTGTLKKGDKPISGATLEFSPADGGRPSYGLTNAEGYFEVVYTENAKGAVVGKHRVKFEMRNDGGGPPANENEARIPGTRTAGGNEKVSGKLSPEEVEVKAGSNKIDFVLQ